MSKVEVKEVSVNYEGFLAVDRVSFSLPYGKHLAIIGPSGCGKTTLLKAIAGLMPYEGEILRPEGPVGYMPQKGVLLPWFFVLKNLEIPLLIKGYSPKEAKERIYPLLEQFGLKGFENSYPKVLSGGMYQRASLLRTLLTDSELLLLDEPFGAVDALNRRKLWLYLEEMRLKFYFSTIMVTHDVEEAVFLSDVVIIMHGYPGKVQEIVNVDIPHPRTIDTLKEATFISIVEYVLSQIINENS
ncbi:MAG: ABC transporter ATP-binding protein [Caldisericaceae bacterium]